MMYSPTKTISLISEPLTEWRGWTMRDEVIQNSWLCVRYACAKQAKREVASTVFLDQIQLQDFRLKCPPLSFSATISRVLMFAVCRMWPRFSFWSGRTRNGRGQMEILLWATQREQEWYRHCYSVRAQLVDRRIGRMMEWMKCTGITTKCHATRTRNNSRTSVALVRKQLYRPSDRRLPAKLVPTFADRGVSRG
jgi:hypothetical protein